MGFGCKFSIGGMNVNCVGVDVSKGKSIIAIIRPLGEMEIPPFEVGLTDAELCELPRRLGDLDGETRVVMEATGNYHLPVASFLYDSGFYVSVVNAMLVHGYGNNSLRRAKTDKKNARTRTACFPALPGRMAARNGWTLLPPFGIVSVSVDCPKKRLRPSTRSGARSTVTTPARWKYAAAASLNVTPLPCVGRCFL